MNHTRSSFSRHSDSGARRAVWTGILVYIGIMGLAGYRQFTFHRYGDFDLAHHTQSLWNILHGASDGSVLGIPFLGNHMVLILYLLAPLYALFQSPLYLLALQTLALAATAGLLYHLGRRHIGPWPAAGLVMAYLVYPPLIHLNLYEFHPVTLSVPLLTLAFIGLDTRRFLPTAIALTLAMLCQENIALIVAGFGILAWFRGFRGRWVWGPLLTGIVYFVVCVGWIMPLLNRDRIQFARLYSHLGAGFGDWIWTLLRHPVTSLATLSSPDRRAFLGALFSPLAFISLADPLTWIPALPVFAQRLLSNRASETTILFHYQAEFIPFIFVSAIHALERLRRCRYRLAARTWITAAALMPLVVLPVSGIVPALQQALDRSPAAVADRSLRDSFVQSIPDDARIAATFRFLPHLSNRSGLHAVHHLYTGFHILSDQPYPVPSLDYLLVDTLDPLTFKPSGFYGPDHHRNLQAILRNPGWQLIRLEHPLLLFQFQPLSLSPLRAATGRVSGPPAGLVIPEWTGTPPPVWLHGVQWEPLPDSTRVRLTFYWQVGPATVPDFELKLILEDPPDACPPVTIIPGHRIWAPQGWPVNACVADEQVLAIPGFKAGGTRPPRLILSAYPMTDSTP
ncbi:MAG: hypothetical protein A2340_10480 [Lentisphaerae bacterium RIFOXYB12_FULL_60_10]|nr:MAG: hypothetical protein A2340_10480 [Lentisphaerae bacterium RIFOXYB12_FULL_60_10]